ncbi:MAG: ECF-type sigma factor [Planctomycetaceae bacterium]
MAGPITQVLLDVQRGTPGARDELFRLSYEALKRLANAQMRDQPQGHTLQPTALVNEACLRLLGSSAEVYRDRGVFFSVASKAMRSILVDWARAKGALKRGGPRAQVTWREDLATWAPSAEEVLSVHDALEKLEGIDPSLARVVDLRFFAGLSAAEAACAMEVSERHLFSLWEHARAWLFRELHA